MDKLCVFLTSLLVLMFINEQVCAKPVTQQHTRPDTAGLQDDFKSGENDANGLAEQLKTKFHGLYVDHVDQKSFNWNGFFKEAQNVVSKYFTNV
jgi:hypothetical protein